jgi:beta-lactamase class A
LLRHRLLPHTRPPRAEDLAAAKTRKELMLAAVEQPGLAGRRDLEEAFVVERPLLGQ